MTPARCITAGHHSRADHNTYCRGPRATVTVDLLRPTGAVAESHTMPTADVDPGAGIIAGRYRDAHGWTPTLRATFADGTPAAWALPRSWRDA